MLVYPSVYLIPKLSQAPSAKPCIACQFYLCYLFLCQRYSFLEKTTLPCMPLLLSNACLM